MRVALLVNPIAGRGRARRLVADYASALRSAGMTVEAVDHQPGATDDLSGHDVATVIGGDGTLNRWLPKLVAARTPVWHVPMGTENLFARSFQHGPTPSRFVRAVREQSWSSIDLGCCGGRLFSIMVSLGPDADVVDAVTTQRRGSIRRLDYARPIATRLVRGLTSSGSVVCDGRTMLDGAIGMLVVANLPAYAARLNPAWEAEPDSGELSVVHLPGHGAIGVALRLLAGIARDPEIVPDRQAIGAKRIEIECVAPPAVQVDGDLLDPSAWEGTRLTISIQPGALRVLTPVD